MRRAELQPEQKRRRRFDVLRSTYLDAAPTLNVNQRFLDRLQERSNQLGVNTPAIAARVAEEIHDVIAQFS